MKVLWDLFTLLREINLLFIHGTFIHIRDFLLSLNIFSVLLPFLVLVLLYWCFHFPPKFINLGQLRFLFIHRKIHELQIGSLSLFDFQLSSHVSLFNFFIIFGSFFLLNSVPNRGLAPGNFAEINFRLGIVWFHFTFIPDRLGRILNFYSKVIFRCFVFQIRLSQPPILNQSCSSVNLFNLVIIILLDEHLWTFSSALVLFYSLKSIETSLAAARCGPQRGLDHWQFRMATTTIFVLRDWEHFFASIMVQHGPHSWSFWWDLEIIPWRSRWPGLFPMT